MESSHGLMTNSPRKRSPASPRDHVDSYLNQPKKIGLKQSEYAAIRACREKEPEFLYQGILFISLAIPFGIMLAFGGKPALIVLCFGSIIAHIFDILGTLEVSKVELSASCHFV